MMSPFLSLKAGPCIGLRRFPTLALTVALALGLASGCTTDEDNESATDMGGVGGEGGEGGGAGGEGGGAGGEGGGAGGEGGGAGGVQPSPSGVAFPMGFRDWQVVGFSKRLDNEQLRVVVGNDIAVQAARAGDTSPWPEGTILADVIRSGGDNPLFAEMEGGDAYAALAVMEKDMGRFADTEGWGYGIWTMGGMYVTGGIESIVNPGDPVDEATCFGCHNNRAADRDFVFTRALALPDDAEIAAASMSAEGQTLPAAVTDWRVVNVHRRLDNGQMRVVLGNDAVIDHVRAGNAAPYPDGAQLADLVFTGEEGSDDWGDWVFANEFRAIAFMQKDAAYDTTGGWGYSIWTNSMGTADLAPGMGGGTADDVATCFGCHNTMVGADADFLFTQPAPVPDAP